VKRLTQLAFVFIPLSFVTSIFGVNINSLAGDGARWWTLVIAAIVVYAFVAILLVLIKRKVVLCWAMIRICSWVFHLPLDENDLESFFN
jgi:hypothetical protein